MTYAFVSRQRLRAAKIPTVARPPQIDRRRVLQASLDIADADGLAAITMQSVAHRLGVTAMSLYRHVKNKGDLLDGVVEALLDEVPTPDPAAGWAQQLEQLGRSVRAVAHRHPSVFPLLLQLPASTAGARDRRDLVLRVLAGAGVAKDDLARVERVVSSMVLGFAASEVSGRFEAHPTATRDEDFAMLEHFVVQGVAALVSRNA